MIFLSFRSQEERRHFGGSGFMELQFCKMDTAATEQQLVALSNIRHWQNDSLYICDADINVFYEQYRNIFNCGLYHNLESGVFDTWGINYYRTSSIGPMIHNLRKVQPVDYGVLTAWLMKAQAYNGFYLLGI